MDKRNQSRASGRFGCGAHRGPASIAKFLCRCAGKLTMNLENGDVIGHLFN
jgi:hypothetical protein